MGMRMVGQQEIIAAHRPWLASIEEVILNKEVTRQDVRYIGSDVALVSLSVDTWYTTDGQNSEREGNSVLITLSQSNGQWVIDQFQVTPILPMNQG